MGSKAVILLVLAATVANGRIISKVRSHPQMLLMPSHDAGFDFHYNPQLPPITFMQPCDEQEVEFKPMPIPVPVPVSPPLPIVEPCEPAMDIPAPPSVVIPARPDPCLTEEVEIHHQLHQPMVVPQPPELPAFVMPELPVVEVSMPEPCLEDQPIPVEPVPEYVPPMAMFVPEKLVVNVPAAPALPPLEMPVLHEIVAQPEPCLDEEVIQEIPQPVLVPQAPELPPFVMPELPAVVEVPMPEPCLEDQPIPVAPIPEYIPPMPYIETFLPEIPAVNIPTAPVLPALEMPVIPEIMIQSEPCLQEEVISEISQPMIVPQAPELPAFVMPELPAIVEDQQVAVAHVPEYIPLPAPMPMPIAEPCEPAPIPQIPFAPELPALEMPVLPEIVQPEPCLDEIVASEPLVVPKAPELPAFLMPELPPAPVPEYIPLPEPIPQLSVAPCPEDLLAAIPQYFYPIAPMPVPELPRSPVPKIPVRVEAPMTPVDPCLGEVALIVPQPSKLPEPIIPAKVDPCEPSAPTKKVAGLPPYFMPYPSYISPEYGFLPGRDLLGMRVPYVRHH